MDITKIVMNWSSGKDAALAYLKLLDQPGCKVSHLLTTLSADYDRVFMHGTRELLLDMQAERMGLQLTKVKLPASPDDGIYRNAMLEIFGVLKKQGVTTAAYGDIFLEDLRAYREQQLAAAGISALFPLWKRDTRELVLEVEQACIEAIIVCVDEKYLGKEFLGMRIGQEFLDILPRGVDACGEHGEFHTFVCNAPFFSSPIEVERGEIVHRTYQAADATDKGWSTGFYFLDLLPL